MTFIPEKIHAKEMECTSFENCLHTFDPVGGDRSKKSNQKCGKEPTKT